MTPVERVLSRLQGARKEGSQWKAHCPAHDDRHESLSVHEGKEGRALVNCHAGCSCEEVVSALGLAARDLFPSRDPRSLGPIVDVYPYYDETGAEAFQVTRHDPKAFRQRHLGPDGTYRWGRGGAPLVLFRLPDVLEAALCGAQGGAPPTVWIAEGEKDAIALESAGALATCNPGGAGKWDPSFSEALRGFHCVIVRDPDEAGYAHAREVALSLADRAASVRCVEAAAGKDAFDHVSSGLSLARFRDVDPMEPCPPERRKKREKRETKPKVDRDALPPSSPSSASEDGEEGGSPEFMRTDLGNARRLVHFYGTEIRYCADWERWLVWNAPTWEEDTSGGHGARALAQDLTERMARAGDEAERRWGKTCQSSAAISNMMREAQALPGVRVRSRDLDTHDFLLGCSNGVVDLRTGRLVDAPRDLLITKRAGCAWDPDAKAPVFTAFVRAIMRDRKELVDLLLRGLGYSLSGSVKEQKFFLLYGERGQNGKTTLMELMQELLGDGLCFTINKKLLTGADRDSARFAVAALEGKRLVYANEASRGTSRFDTEFIKDFAGGSTLKAEKKGKDEYQFKNRGKLWYAVNTLPSADVDDAFMRRLVPIPFEQSFFAVGDERYRPGDLPPDGDLPERLRAEMPGILALLAKGFQRWHEKGLGMPQEVRDLRAQYEAENDSVADWMRDRCRVDPSGRVRQADAWKDYAEWAKATRPSSPHKKRVHFKHDLAQRPGIEERAPGGVDFFAGISIVDPHALPMEDGE